jgi:hypothetical protein
MTKQITEGLLGLGGAESVSIYLLDLDRAQCSLVSAADSPDWIRDSEGRDQRALSDLPFLAEIVATGLPADWLVADEGISSGERALHREDGTAAILVLPLNYADDRLGFVSFEKRLPEPFARRNIDLRTWPPRPSTWCSSASERLNSQRCSPAISSPLLASPKRRSPSADRATCFSAWPGCCVNFWRSIAFISSSGRSPKIAATSWPNRSRWTGKPHWATRLPTRELGRHEVGHYGMLRRAGGDSPI